MSRARMALVAVVLIAVTSGCTTFAQAQAPPQPVAPTDAQRRECERNGGYWSVAAGFCRVGQ